MVHLLKLCILSLLPVWEILCAARTHDLYTQHDEAEVATSACAPSCSLMHNRSKAWRIASLRAHILSELRLSHSPNVSSLVVPDAPPLRDLLQKHKFQENGRLSRSDTEEHPITEKIIILASKPNHDQLMSLKIKPKCCFFKINQDILSRIIVKADLWICLKPLRHDTDVTVRLTRLQHMGDGDLGRVRLRSINMHVTASDVTQWHSIDAKKLLQEELEHLQPKWGLEIHALDPEGQDVVITDQTQAGDERLKPFLDLEFAELKKQVKRSLGLDCTEASGEMQCCRYMLVVDFNAIGFDWVIAPKTYRAYYCTGLCNQMSLQRYPHTHLVSRVNADGWGPCCSPTKMSAISMIYFNNQQNIMSSKISDMVVDRCGCS